MRIKLSQRGWNNVLIFASMFMILLFNGVHKKLFENQSEQITAQAVLVEASEFIQGIDYPGLKLQKVGVHWQSVADELSLKSQDISQLVYSWQHEPMQLVAELTHAELKLPSFVVSVWLAGQDKARFYQVYLDEEVAFVRNGNAVWQLNIKQLHQFVPSQLLNQ